MNPQAANVIDFLAYRARRLQHSSLTATTHHEFAQNRLVFAVPVLMPIVVAWLPMWSMAAILSGAPNE